MKCSGNNVLLVSCSGDLKKIARQIQRTVLPILVEWGISEVALPNEWRLQRQCRELYRRSPHGFLIHRSVTDMDPDCDQIAVPRVSVYFPEEGVPFDRNLLQIDRPAHIIFCDSQIRDPRRPQEHFFDRASHISYTNVLGNLQS